VYREPVQPGGLLTRVAASHIRVGTFEFVRNMLPATELQPFVQYVIDRHYHEAAQAERPALALLEAVIQRQVNLIVHWMRVGFIHGVMNTDNMSIAGETIDYGPCAFMNAYHPRTVFSSIDTRGRYAFGNQPGIAQWNLAIFAGTLLPLIDADPDQSLALAQAAVDRFQLLYEGAYLAMMCAKFGIADAQPTDRPWIDEFLGLLAEHRLDYTNAFLVLDGRRIADDPAFDSEAFLQWKKHWLTRVGPNGPDLALMHRTNPVLIPRNHRVENALVQAAKFGDTQPLLDLLEALQKPYDANPKFADYQLPPPGGDVGYRTFCGT
jgi:uncharacterized protein YdiU (UPF0061 family)